MEIKDRIAAMTSDLPPLTIGTLDQSYVPGGDSPCSLPHARSRSSFSVDAGGKSLATVSIDAAHGTQEQVDTIAIVLHALFSGSEGRVADAEQRALNLRQALHDHKVSIAGLQAQLADFEAGRYGRGDSYAMEAESGAVWLCGRPDGEAFGLRFKSWRDLASEFPGLRPAGVKDGHVIMRPIGSMGKDV